MRENSSYKLFITNRFLRLYPIYWCVFLLTVIFCAVLSLKTPQSTTFSFYSAVVPNIFSTLYLAFSNIFIFGQDIAMYLGINSENGKLFFTKNFIESPPYVFRYFFIPQAWTLALELTFYLIAPFILHKGWRTVISLIILSFLLRLFLFNFLNLQYDPWTYRFFPTELMFFLLGYMSYQIYLKIKDVKIRKIYIFLLYGLVVSFSVVYTFLPQFRIEFSPFSVKEILYFPMIIFSIPLLFLASKKSRIDSQIGELSYPVYISHLLVYTICMNLPFVQLRSGLSIALLTILFSIVLNKLIADPVEKFRQSRLSK